MRKPGPPREVPPPLELECLKALWTLGEANVKEVRRLISLNKNLAYTTVMTVLERLVRKGVVERRKVGRSFAYLPVVSRDTVRRAAVKELVASFFGGSEAELLRYLTTNESPPPAPGESPPSDTLDTALL